MPEASDKGSLPYSRAVGTAKWLVLGDKTCVPLGTRYSLANVGRGAAAQRFSSLFRWSSFFGVDSWILYKILSDFEAEGRPCEECGASIRPV